LRGVLSQLRTNWGASLRRARLFADLTQVELAQLAGVTQQRISAWESGVSIPRDEARVQLARVLQTTVAELFPYPNNDGEGEAA
jgi:transcriptional regulator with XRE-family HTH domain